MTFSIRKTVAAGTAMGMAMLLPIVACRNGPGLGDPGEMVSPTPENLRGRWELVSILYESDRLEKEQGPPAESERLLIELELNGPRTIRRIRPEPVVNAFYTIAATGDGVSLSSSVASGQLILSTRRLTLARVRVVHQFRSQPVAEVCQATFTFERIE